MSLRVPVEKETHKSTYPRKSCGALIALSLPKCRPAAARATRRQFSCPSPFAHLHFSLLPLPPLPNTGVVYAATQTTRRERIQIRHKRIRNKVRRWRLPRKFRASRRRRSRSEPPTNDQNDGRRPPQGLRLLSSPRCPAVDLPFVSRPAADNAQPLTFSVRYFNRPTCVHFHSSLTRLLLPF